MKSMPGMVHVISEYVAPVNSTGYYWSRIIQRMAGAFGRVVVWYPDSSERSTSIGSWITGVEPRPVQVKSVNKRNLFTRAMGELRFIFAFAWRLLWRVRRGDVVLSGTNPVLLILLLMFVKKLRRCQWVLVAYDVFPENMVAAGLASKPGMLFFLMKKMFDSAYASASVVVVIGRDMRELMLRKGVLSDRIVVQPNWADPLTISPQSRATSKLLRELNVGDRIVFQFFGNIGRVQGIDNLLRGISLVTASNAAFVFIGDGAMVDAVKEHADGSHKNPVFYAGNWPMEANQEMLSACDVAIVSLSKNMYGLGVPSKAYFSMAADKPLLVIGDDGSELVCMVKEHKVGWACSPGEPQALARTIDEICRTGTESLRGKPRKVLCAKFSEDLGLSKYADIVERLLGDNEIS